MALLDTPNMTQAGYKLCNMLSKELENVSILARFSHLDDKLTNSFQALNIG